MKLIDTHCHLFLEEFDQDRDVLIKEARENGIEALLLPNIDETTIDRLHELCDLYPDFAYPMMGLHPTSVDGRYAQKLSLIESCLHKRQYYAIGEIGIDLYWDKTFLKEQKAVFEEQLRWSVEYSLPVSIHTREAYPEVFDSLYNVGVDKLSGVFHSFSGTEDDLLEIEKMKAFNIGINGVVTFKNSRLSEVIKSFDVSRVVLETDAPYLAPTPYRGRKNVPLYIRETAKKVAETYSMSLEELALLTTENVKSMFNFTGRVFTFL
jgi:hydrolase, TatD family